MKCYKPVDCCTCAELHPGEVKRDSCLCGCGYLNGGFQVAIAQALLLFGNFLSIAALGDCSFAEIKIGGLLIPFEDNVPRRIGFIFFERPDGMCYWYDEGFYPEDQIQTYFDLLGSDWQISRMFACIALSAGWLYWFYSLSFCCSAQLRAVRYMNAFMISLGIATFQGMSFLVFNSPFCAEQECKMDRSAGFSIAATGCYFFAGLFFLCMSDYPGKYAVADPALKEEPKEVDEEAGEGAAVEQEEVEEIPKEEEEPVAEAEASVIEKGGEPQDQEQAAVSEQAESSAVEEQVVEAEEAAAEAATVQEEMVEEEVIEEEFVEEEEEAIYEDSARGASEEPFDAAGSAKGSVAKEP